jgi:hypothetical protein
MESIATQCKLLIALCALYLTGCAGPTKPDVPTHLPVLGEEMARIVFTREKQVAGAGSPFIVIDIGDQIEPNAMIHMAGLTLDEVLAQENVASEIGTPVNFLWFDATTVRPLYCADNGPGCIVYHWLWPREDQGGLLFGSGVQIQANCFIVYLPLIDDEFYREIMRYERKPVGLPVDHACIKEHLLVPHENSKSKERLAISKTKRVQGYSYPPDSFYLITGLFRSSDSMGETQFTTLTAEILTNQQLSRELQVLGSTEVGETLIWDRKPGIMRLGSVWYDGVGFMPRNVMVEAGKTYYVHYTTRLGPRWELKRIE